MAPAAMACPAIAVSFGPIGVPAAASAVLFAVVASTTRLDLASILFAEHRQETHPVLIPAIDLLR